MPRKRRHSRRRSLVFTESPLNGTKTFCSPVLGAAHPVTADIVQVDEDLDLQWVSPQFNPNSENSPPRRRRKGTRTRAACSVTTSSRQLLLKNDSSRTRNHSSNSRQAPKAQPKGFTCLNFVGDKEDSSPSTQYEIDTYHSGSSPKNGAHTRSRSRPTTSKQYGGRPMNCSVNQTLNPNDFEVTRQRGQTDDHNTSESMHRLQGSRQSDNLNHEIRVRRSCRLRRQSALSPCDPSQGSRFRRLVCDGGERESNLGRVLACDTPEVDYGLKVSIRRRRDLLPIAARNKLLSL